MAKEQPNKQEGESHTGNIRTNREVMPDYVKDTYDSGTEEKWCRGCGGIFFTEKELKEKHTNAGCDAKHPKGGVEKLLKE